MRGRYARPAAVQPSRCPDPAERLLDGRGCERRGALGAEEASGPAGVAASVAVGAVAGERLGGARMERDEAALAELALPNGQHAGVEVDVAAFEPAGLRQPQPGRG